MRENVEDLARCLQAVAVPTRIRILCLLKQHPLCVGAITGRLGVTQGAVSQHLRILREAGFVQAERRGQHMHYRVCTDAIAAVRNALEQVLQCEGHAATAQAAGPDTRHGDKDDRQSKRFAPGLRRCHPEQSGRCHAGKRNHPCASKGNRK